MLVRKVQEDDLEGLLKLYAQLHENDDMPVIDEAISTMWNNILNTPHHHVIVAEDDGVLAATCSITVIPNISRGARPYAIVENVATDKERRNKGYARACLNHAEQIALDAGCYKMSLTTRPANEAAKTLYSKLGYSGDLRQAYVKWLHGEVR